MAEYVTFEPEEKIRLFDKIADCFYNVNFGQLSKADIELMMFMFYIKKMISGNKNADGTIDYRKCSEVLSTFGPVDKVIIPEQILANTTHQRRRKQKKRGLNHPL